MTRTRGNRIIYTTPEVCEMTGATYRQVDHWARKGWIPGQPAEVGSGMRRRWTPAQVERVGVLLKASKLSNSTITQAVELLERVCE